jgi:hypothetical protein
MEILYQSYYFQGLPPSGQEKSFWSKDSRIFMYVGCAGEAN